MSTDHNEAMRLADALDAEVVRTVQLDVTHSQAASLLRQQAELIAELQSAHAIAVEIAAQYAAERDQLRAEVALQPWRPISPKRIAALWAEACKPDRPTCDMVEAFVRLIEADHGIDLARTTHKETE